MTCAAHIRPFPNDIEIVCELHDEHSAMHRGSLRDYAYPGSVTVMEWADDDRRNYRGAWPGDCPGCVLPLGHRGGHAE